jgi:transposase-like protein
LRLSLPEWRALLQWFVRGASSAEIARETGLERKRVLRALMLVRRAILHTASHRARRTTVLSRKTRAATIGLRPIDGQVWAEVIPDAQADQLGRWLRERTGRLPLALHTYAAVVHRGRLHRLAQGSGGRAPFGQFEAFWAYLQRQLRATGGIRRERLGLYLAAFAWRYNHRKLPRDEQVSALLALLRAPY